MSLTIEQTINQLVIQQVDGDTLEITTQGPQGPPGATYSFTVAGNSGPSQVINDGNTLTLTSPVTFQQVVMSATDTATLSWPNQTGRVFLASPADGSSATPSFRAITFADLDAVLGTMAQQDANAVVVTGGTLDGVTIGGTTAGAGTFTTLQANTSLTVASDTNATTILGRVRLNSPVSDTAFFRHFDMTGGTQYALSQNASGGTNINAASGQVIGFNIAGTAAGVLSATGLRLGDSGSPGAPLHLVKEDAGTADTQDLIIIARNSTGTPAANFASRIRFQLESSTNANRDAAAMDVVWTTAADATRTSRMDFYVASSGTLTSVMIVRPTGITPSGNITFDLGSTLQRWANVFAANFVTDNGSNHVLLDGGTNGGMIELITSADTNVATRPTLAMSHRSSGTVAAGFGQTLVFQLESSTTNETNAGAIETSWVVPTHASRTARVRYLVYDTAEREAMRLEASGSAPMIGFLGANAIARYSATGITAGFTAGAGAAVDSAATFTGNLGATAYTIGDAIRALKEYGLLAQ